MLLDGIRSLIGVTRFLPIHPFQCSTPTRYARRQPKSCFGENQLLPGSISFSLLVTSHPKALYDQRVRASPNLSVWFTLLMTSSPGFGSYARDKRAIHTRFPFGSGVLPLSQAAVRKLAGSFFNRHAVEDITRSAIVHKT